MQIVFFVLQKKSRNKLCETSLYIFFLNNLLWYCGIFLLDIDAHIIIKWIEGFSFVQAPDWKKDSFLSEVLVCWSSAEKLQLK